MKLKMERREGLTFLAKRQGRELEPHEGYLRGNDGSWRICDEDGYGVITVLFQGKAKRGQAYDAPDPVGQAMAFRIIELWNANEEK